ncbi:MAG TPA: protein TolQ [Pseudomonadales bacterium]|nr:protein TolQ [Gammaproteobacteria bacterium]MDP6026791.1 protein TolQ [Pseudomonadales bacterium]MDP6317503.1 protein TolQ [Pseudomonadales bacterium]MDP7315013.1 protein TolQ [Pseudomonadales bacterium]HJL61158.1 protein TolQ [Pseudomonadales bacterium]
MNEPLSIVEIIFNASWQVLLVMALLMLASLTSWVMIFQRGFLLNATRRESSEFENEFWLSGKDLRKIFEEIESRTDQPVGLEQIFSSGFKEFSRLSQQEGSDPDRVMQNVQRAMRVALSREEERLETHLVFLATVGSTSPYIGLFGTVWGIMNSFRNLATVEQASLSIVAPGISEALIATAMGLFAAIPAVIAYNRYSAQVEIIVNRFEAFTDEFSGILYRAIHNE